MARLDRVDRKRRCEHFSVLDARGLPEVSGRSQVLDCIGELGDLGSA